MARTGCCAAVVGSTTAGMPGLLIATGTTLPTATTIPAFAWPELKNSAGWHFFDPAFILPAYDIIYPMQQKEIVPRYASAVFQKFFTKFWQFSMSRFVEVTLMHFKFEARSTKSETISKYEFSKFKTKAAWYDAVELFLFCSFEFCSFEFVSNFDIRISDLPAPVKWIKCKHFGFLFIAICR